MFRMILAVGLSMGLGSQLVMAQADSAIDTISVVQSATTTYDGQIVDYFVIDDGDQLLQFIEDSAYVKLLGFIRGVDTLPLPQATVWMKTHNPQVGDSWAGMVPRDEPIFTQESIEGTKMVTVPAGTFLVYEIGVYDEYGRYLGEKWYNDGIGLVGWDLQRCNEVEGLRLVDSDFSGGGFWPHQVGDLWVYEFKSNRTSSNAPTASITVNGNGSDWASIAPVLQDPSGDDPTGFAGADVRDVYVAVDGVNLYLMSTFWDGSPDTNWAIAHDPAYAFVFDDNGMGTFWGYALAYEPAPVSSWHVGGLRLPDAGASVAVGNVVEVSIPLANLGSYRWDLPYFAFAVDSGLYDVSCFNDVRLPVVACPISLTGDMQGDHNLTSSDIIFMVNFVLKAGPPPVPCPAVGDVNCNGAVSTSDIIYLVNRVFKAGPDPCDVCNWIPSLWSCP